MANIVQKMIYNLSAIAPLTFVFAIVWIMQKATFIVPIIVTGMGIILIMLFTIFFSYGIKKMAPINVRVAEVSAYDGWITGYIISYLLPFASIVIDDWDVIVFSIIAAILGLSMSYMNAAIPNPILMLKQYHFYQISSGNGISGYVLISKRKLRNKNDVKVVYRMFDFLLIDKEG